MIGGCEEAEGMEDIAGGSMKNPKVGERVVMYLADKRVTGFIKEVYNDKTPTVLFIEDGNFYEWCAHPKQLRRLVPKKRRER